MTKKEKLIAIGQLGVAEAVIKQTLLDSTDPRMWGFSCAVLVEEAVLVALLLGPGN
jgi:hypothetical protein